LDKPVTGAGYYYGVYATERFNLSSLVRIATADELKGAGVKATLQPSRIIEPFESDWQKEWFTYRPESWARSTHKIYEPQWCAPAAAKLALDVRSAQPGKLAVGLDGYATEVLITGGAEWQSIMLQPADFRDAEEKALSSWTGLKELRLGAKEMLRSKKEGAKTLSLGGDWNGNAPEFRSLRWE
jgi:hypothetical protein